MRSMMASRALIWIKIATKSQPGWITELRVQLKGLLMVGVLCRSSCIDRDRNAARGPPCIDRHDRSDVGREGPIDVSSFRVCCSRVASGYCRSYQRAALVVEGDRRV